MLQETHLLQSEMRKLQSTKYTNVYGASFNSKKKGVMILINKNISITNKVEISDPEGRYIIINASIINTEMTIANIYGPNTDNDEIFHKVFSIVSTFPQSKIIIGGDFNTVLNPSLDKSTDTIKQYMIELGLGDSWRLNNPTTRDYTYFSPVHKTYSRIDFFLINNSIIQDITDTKINPIVISDHAPISLTFNNKNHFKTPQRWRMNTSLLQDKEFNEYFKKEWTSFIEINDTPEISASILWETAKAVLRGKIISYSAYKHKLNQQKEEE